MATLRKKLRRIRPSHNTFRPTLESDIECCGSPSDPQPVIKWLHFCMFCGILDVLVNGARSDIDRRNVKDANNTEMAGSGDMVAGAA